MTTKRGEPNPMQDDDVKRRQHETWLKNRALGLHKSTAHKWTPTEAQRERLRNLRRGPLSEEERKMHSQRMRSYRPSEETRRRMSVSAVRRVVKAKLATSRLEDVVSKHLDNLSIAYRRQYILPSAPWFSWDFYLPESKTLIEVDGCYWHGCDQCKYPGMKSNRKADKAKNTYVNNHGLKLIRLREHDVLKANFECLANLT